MSPERLNELMAAYDRGRLDPGERNELLEWAVNRLRRLEAAVRPVLDIVRRYSCECDGGIPTPDGVFRCLRCMARDAEALIEAGKEKK